MYVSFMSPAFEIFETEVDRQIYRVDHSLASTEAVEPVRLLLQIYIFFMSTALEMFETEVDRHIDSTQPSKR